MSNKKLSLTVSKDTELLYMEKDIQDMLLNYVAPRQWCIMLLSTSMLMAHSKTTPREDRSIGQIVMHSPYSSCKNLFIFTRKRYSNKFQHCFEISQERIWTKVPTATPDTRYEEKD